jgi:hypothetical protein
LFAPVLDRPRSRSRKSRAVLPNHTGTFVVQHRLQRPSTRSCTASQSTLALDRTPTTQAHHLRPNPHSARCAAAVPLPAISCLGAFRTPAASVPWLARQCRRPKTLYGAYRCQEKTRHVLSHFVTSLDCICGTAALLLGCAELSEPRSRVSAEAARLDRECAGRVTIWLPRRTNVFRAPFDLLCGFLFCSFSFDRHASSNRSQKIRFDMIRGELAIGREIAPQPCIRSIREDRTMMQSCASAAKLRGGGSTLHSGLEAMVFTSDHRHLGFIGKPLARGRQVGCPVVLPFRLLSLFMPDVRRCHPTLRRSWRDARAR